MVFRNTGRTHFKKGHIPWNKGKAFSVEIKEKMRGINSPHFKDGRSVKPTYCVDCGKSIYWKSTRCAPCRYKFAKGKNGANYIDGRYSSPHWSKPYTHARRSREKAAGKLSIKTIQMVYEDNIKRYGTLTCYLCLKPIEFKKDSLEHKTPLCRGGTNEYNNLAVACISCNSGKRDKTEVEYRRIKNGPLVPTQ
jgi:5-methylcytosine-specific restriction endonuclease McrA